MISKAALKKKKFILVGGSNRSGTTILNLILANDPKAMALGEITNLFYPGYKHHVQLIRQLEKDPIWGIILSEGPKKLYSNLIKFFPDVDYFIDSSKKPEWYKNQMNFNPSLDFKNILIFKHPDEQKKSFLKRNSKSNWERIILNYYRRYFFTVPNFRTVSLSAVLKNKMVLKAICNYLEIPYFEGKYDYWNKKHPNFFGSETTKKSFIDLTGVKDLNSLEDLNRIQKKYSLSIISIYNYMLGQAIWLDKPQPKDYPIPTWKGYYLILRNILAIKITRLQYYYKGDFL